MTEQLPRRLSAVMFTDVVGYTAMMQEDEEAARVVRLRHREAVGAAIAAHGGELVQYLGDGSLSTFPSAVRAVSAAIEIQRTLREDVALRIGVHQGEVAFDEQGIYGDSVNVASRVMGLGTAGSVLVSEKVHDELKNQRDLSTASLGQFHMKNVKHPPTVYAVEADGLAVPTRDDLLPFTESTPVYKGVTQHWPKIALAATAIAVAVGLVLPDLTVGASLQSYAFAWAVATAGIWFLFDKAETAMSARSRKRVGSWLQELDLGPVIESIPAQFASLFDRVFGERHLSLRCFFRSSVASVFAVLCLYLVVFGVTGSGGGPADVWVQFGTVAVFAVFLNVIPDYLSLLETRWAIRWMERSRRTLPILALDALLTAVISGVIMVGFSMVTRVGVGWRPDAAGLLEAGRFALLLPEVVLEDGSFGMGIFFYSAFLTSVWLWLYVLAVVVSRVLVRMNSGVGFLLRVTDVERHPFRSMGFVSVIIVSGIFAVGVPLVVAVPQAARIVSPTSDVGTRGGVASDGTDPAPVLSCIGQPDAAIVTFVDANLEAEVRSALGVGTQIGPTGRRRGDLTCGLVAGLTLLSAYDASIASPVGIQNLTSLTELVLNRNSITDINALSGLTSLERLFLYGNSITDISALSGLTNLRDLVLHTNSITDISAVSGLTSLTTLTLNANSISDIGALSGLTSLEWLELNNNSITDISALSRLTSLRTLILDDNSITDITALSGLTSLVVLYLRDNSLSDISALSGLTSLETLFLGDNSISNLEPLSELTRLQRLRLGDNPDLSNIQPLLNNSGLGEGDGVRLVGTNVSCADVAALEAKGVSVTSDCP